MLETPKSKFSSEWVFKPEGAKMNFFDMGSNPPSVVCRGTAIFGTSCQFREQVKAWREMKQRPETFKKNYQ